MSGLGRNLKHALWLPWVVMCLAIINSGCRNLDVNDTAPAEFNLPKPRMENDSVAVRVALAEFDDHQNEDFESFIDIADQKLPLELRQRLDQNGFRVAVVSNVNSQQLQKLLAPRTLETQWLSENERELAAAGKLEPLLRVASQRHVESHRGEAFHVEVSPVRSESTWALHDNRGGEAILDHATLAQCEMRITSWPQPDGSVRLQFVPEIHHGQSLSQIGIEGQDLALRQRRQVKALRSLAFEVEVQLGETVMIAPTATLDRLGGLFFGAGESFAEGGQAPGSAEEAVDENLASQFFPMLGKPDPAAPSDSVEMLLTGDDLLDGAASGSGSRHSDRPRPWQRTLLVRVVEVTPPAIP